MKETLVTLVMDNGELLAFVDRVDREAKKVEQLMSDGSWKQHPSLYQKRPPTCKPAMTSEIQQKLQRSPA